MVSNKTIVYSAIGTDKVRASTKMQLLIIQQAETGEDLSFYVSELEHHLKVLDEFTDCLQDENMIEKLTILFK